MESKINRGKEVLVEKLDLPKDVLLNVPKIIVIGRNEVTIENHKGIMLFERENKNKYKHVADRNKGAWFWNIIYSRINYNY